MVTSELLSDGHYLKAWDWCHYVNYAIMPILCPLSVCVKSIGSRSTPRLCCNEKHSYQILGTRQKVARNCLRWKKLDFKPYIGLRIHLSHRLRLSNPGGLDFYFLELEFILSVRSSGRVSNMGQETKSTNQPLVIHLIPCHHNTGAIGEIWVLPNQVPHPARHGDAANRTAA